MCFSCSTTGSGLQCNRVAVTQNTKTLEWIQRAKLVHGDKYCYDKAVYIRNKSKVDIFCRKCMQFFAQPPNDHLAGHGCRSCLTKSTADFIAECQAVHGTALYDYDRVNYQGVHTKVEIFCKGCNSYFWQAPSNHLAGRGCRSCGNQHRGISQRKSRDSFILEARAVHGDDAYGYDRVVYQQRHKKVEIFCNTCNQYFLQTPGNHLKGGCRKCGKIRGAEKQAKSTEKFITQSQVIHGPLSYNYSSTVYIRARSKVKITCNTCSLEFSMTPSDHLKAHGCPACALENRRKSTEQFIHDARPVHRADKYCYARVIYKSALKKVEIFCNTCNRFFWQTPNDHLCGHGCLRCCDVSVSKPETRWLDSLGVEIRQHKIRLVEKPGKKFTVMVDGFDPATNTVYEFHGDFWHGNPRRFAAEAINKKCKISYGELYQKTLAKEQAILASGYRLVVIWESDWLAQESLLKRSL